MADMPEDDFDGLNQQSKQASEDFVKKRRTAWHKLCVKNKSGQLASNAENAMVALRHDPELMDMLAFDQMAHMPMVTRELGSTQVLDEPRVFTDIDMNRIMMRLQRAGLTSISLTNTRAAVETVGADNAYHPVREYLEHQVWDGTRRINVWLSTCLGAELNQYTQVIGELFLIGMVARIYQPGCQLDYMMVTEGEQGILKSSAFKVLVGDRYFSDSLPEVKDIVECGMHMRGKWLIEISELNAMKRAEITALKAFLTRRIERYRPKWGRGEVVEPRQCVFAGTTNETHYMRDPSGNRRFWPVRVGVSGPIRLDYLEKMRDQLFAEATHWYREGNPWWPDKQFEDELVKPEQAERYEGDIWEDKVGEYVRGRERVRIRDILDDCLGLKDKDMQSIHEKRVASILTELGWRSWRSNGRRLWRAPGTE